MERIRDEIMDIRTREEVFDHMRRVGDYTITMYKWFIRNGCYIKMWNPSMYKDFLRHIVDLSESDKRTLMDYYAERNCHHLSDASLEIKRSLGLSEEPKSSCEIYPMQQNDRRYKILYSVITPCPELKSGFNWELYEDERVFTETEMKECCASKPPSTDLIDWKHINQCNSAKEYMLTELCGVLCRRVMSSVRVSYSPPRSEAPTPLETARSLMRILYS